MQGGSGLSQGEKSICIYTEQGDYMQILNEYHDLYILLFFGTNICLGTTYIIWKASYLDRLQTTCKTIRGELTNMLLYRF